MTITLHFWMLPSVLIFCGVSCAAFMRRHGDYDFFPHMCAMAFFLAALCVTVGHFL